MLLAPLERVWNHKFESVRIPVKVERLPQTRSWNSENGNVRDVGYRFVNFSNRLARAQSPSDNTSGSRVENGRRKHVRNVGTHTLHRFRRGPSRRRQEAGNTRVCDPRMAFSRTTAPRNSSDTHVGRFRNVASASRVAEIQTRARGVFPTAPTHVVLTTAVRSNHTAVRMWIKFKRPPRGACAD